MKIHLLGIGGTGMASLAGMLQAKGHEVTGSDQGIYPPMSHLLADLGIPVRCPYDAQHLEEFKPELVIVGNVISRGNCEAEAVLERMIPYQSMPQAIKNFFLSDKKSLVVAGTHGKTTTTSLLSWVLESTGQHPSFFVGGKPKNFPQNFQLGQGPYFVLEGDEYDTAFFDKGPKFLHYQPNYLILTGIEFDHADIYRDLDHVMSSFEKLIKIIPKDGAIIANWDNSNVQRLLRTFNGEVIKYGMFSNKNSGLDFSGEIFYTREKTRFQCRDEWSKNPSSYSFEWSLPGQHNVSNALAVIALGRKLNLTWPSLQKAMQTFQGVRRRQDKLGEVQGRIILDDFAHHPTAVKETIAAIRHFYPDKRLWAVFEPRSNTSKRDTFQKEYPQSLLEADRVLISDVYQPEKVKSGKTLNTNQVVSDINQMSKTSKAQHFSGVDKIYQTLLKDSEPGDVILMMSNGDFQGLAQKLLLHFKEGK